MRVLLATNHPLARAAVRESLRRQPGIEHVEDASLDLDGVQSCDADLVVVEQTLDRFSLAELDRVTARCPDRAVLLLALDRRNEYSWVRMRAALGWYVVEAAGVGTIADALRRADAARVVSRLSA